MTELTTHFQYLLDKNGTPENVLFPSEDFVEKHREKIPDSILGFWQAYGIGEWFGGLLRFTDPDDYRSILALWFGADKDFSHSDCSVIARNAFGDLFVWSKKYMRVKIDASDALLASTYFLEPDEEAKPEIVVASTFITTDSTEAFDEFDENDKPLFKRCVAKFGPLEPDEIYGFKLPLALGGARNIDNLQKVKAKEHLMILAQTEPLKLMDYSDFPPRFVREIG